MRSLTIRFFILLGLFFPTLASAVTPMVAAGGYHTVALKSDGTVVAWGNNVEGERCGGATLGQVPGLSGVSAVAGGRSHTVVLKSDGTVLICGRNFAGQLGNGATTDTNQLSPMAVPGLTGVTAVAAGSYHTVALKANTTVMTWGNAYVSNNSTYPGMLPDGSFVPGASASPVVVSGLTGVTAVAAGEFYSVALKSDGKVVAWGYNGYGQLGDGTTVNRLSPVAVMGLTGVTAVAAGEFHSVALKSDGTVVAWGDNSYGQLGDGTTVNRLSPVAVVGLTGVVAVAAGLRHTVALKSDGTVVAWGYNGYGQLGDGTTVNRLSPVAVVGLTQAVAVAAGVFHSVALKSDGTVVAWGWNSLAQLGDGTNTDRLIPVAVMGGVNLTKVSQAISFGIAPTIVVGGTGTVLATTTSALAVSFSSTTPAICTVSGSTLIGVAMGTCTIAANQAGNATYSAATQVTQSFSITQAVPAVLLAPASLTFPSQEVGVVSAPQSITLTNTGGILLNINSIVTNGDFATTKTCVSTLAAGASCTISVAFIPTYSGARSGNLSISSDAAGSPHLLPINGNATYTVLSYPLQLEQGWNLLGNSINKVLSVGRIYGDSNVVTTVWKWDAKNSGWQFYAPSMTSATLQTYAASKGYGILTDINPGEGYWVNSKVKTILPSPTAVAFAHTANNLVTGWNLVGTGNDVSPSAFNSSLSAITPAVSITTLWAWDALSSKWYFYAPSLDSQGGTALTSYIASKGYLDFTTANKTLGKGTGFWVNSTNLNTTPPATISGIVAMGLPWGFDALLKQDTNGQNYIEAGDRVTYCDGYSQQTGAYVSCSEVNSDGKYSIQQAAKDVGSYIWGKVEGTWLGKKVTQVGVSLNNGLDKITNNVNPLTTLHEKVFARNLSPNEPIGDFPAANLPSNPGMFDTAWQRTKQVFGPSGATLGTAGLSSDPLFVADPSVDARDKTIEKYDASYDSAGNIIINDKTGKNVATAPITNVANGTVSGDAQTITQAEDSAAEAAWLYERAWGTKCVSPNVVLNGQCVASQPTCTLPQVLQGNSCVTPTLFYTGNWVGTWQWSGPGSIACTFTDGGAFSMTLTQSGSSVSGSTSGGGVQTKNSSSCSLVSTTSETGSVSGTTSVSGLNLSFSLYTLNFSGTASISGNTLTGTFTRTTGGQGTFTVTKQ